jgi:Raf kinase inhibitor-like YbhB/YbcL family protein
VPIFEGYGLTETAPVLTSTAVSPEVRAGCVGHPVPGVEVAIAAPDGTAAEPGTVGEVRARGPNVFAGYLGRRSATAEVLSDDGWFSTGDLGCLDREGYLTLAGRLKEMLIVSGFNVYPREVESALLSHPDVAEAAVFGVPDARTGERVRAAVVARTGRRLDVDALGAHCRARLARYKVPRDIDVVAALPRTALGKLARGELREAGSAPAPSAVHKGDPRAGGPPPMAAFRLTSPAFEHDEDLPERFLGDADDTSPPLAWEAVPQGTKELVVVAEDPDSDSGVVTHWIVYGIAPDVTGLPEDLGNSTLIDDPDAVQGLNEFDASGWSGPTLDADRGAHRLFFRLFALDAELDLPPGATRVELRQAAKGHLIAQAELVGIA